MIGKTLGHYRVLEQIGSGGMGVVYSARDERLERDVALKLLPAGTLTDETARKRFRREALALSQLNHPNIVTVHDFDTQDGVDFLVLERVAGETLDARLASGPMSEREVLKLGAQLAAGLEAAHHHGVVHRDLKPANVRITPDGRLKILDFGLARLLQPIPDRTPLSSLLDVGQVAGTLPYMAPEQLAGEKADARSDLYAAGAVLYEMATGRRPFPQTEAPALMYAILNQAPEPPRAANPRVSAGLESIILKALEKDPELRYQSARELRVDLERASAPSSAGVAGTRAGRRARVAVPGWVAAVGALAVLAALLWSINPGDWRDRLGSGGRAVANSSIAVLPLANLSGDPQQEYFADGMTDELITSMGKISALRVIARSSVMEYKGTHKSLHEIARALRVAALLEGSVLRSQDRVRITAQLIQAASEKLLWSESYERNLSDVLALQSEVSLAIAREIQVKLTPQERARFAAPHTVDPQAHEAYLRGRYQWNKSSRADKEKGLEYLHRAIEIDPGYALAYAGLADAYYGVSNWWMSPAKAMPLARAAAEKALVLDPTLSEAHTMLGIIKAQYDWDFAQAMVQLGQGAELNPNSAMAHLWMGYVQLQLGQLDQARGQYDKAKELDPLAVNLVWLATWPSFYQRRYDEAIQRLNDVIDLDHGFSDGYALLGETYEQKGDFARALVELRRAESLGSHAWTEVAIGRVYAETGRRDSALRVIDELEERAKKEYVTPYGIATIYAALGDRDHAFEWLEKAFRDRCEDVLLMKVDPRIDRLRTDPRFAPLLVRAGLAPRNMGGAAIEMPPYHPAAG